MFTKRHYEMVAKVINKHTRKPGNVQIAVELMDDFGDMFAKDNDRFDRAKFNQACINPR